MTPSLTSSLFIDGLCLINIIGWLTITLEIRYQCFPFTGSITMRVIFHQTVTAYLGKLANSKCEITFFCIGNFQRFLNKVQFKVFDIKILLFSFLSNYVEVIRGIKPILN